MNNNNKITLFHLLSATAANQNSKSSTEKEAATYQEAVEALPYREEKTLGEDPSITALFEDTTVTQTAPYPVRAEQEQAVVLLPADELVEEARILSPVQPWEDSREQASMRVFASNKEAQSKEVIVPVIDTKYEVEQETAVAPLVFLEEDNSITDEVVEHAITTAEAVEVVDDLEYISPAIEALEVAQPIATAIEVEAEEPMDFIEEIEENPDALELLEVEEERASTALENLVIQEEESLAESDEIVLEDRMEEVVVPIVLEEEDIELEETETTIEYLDSTDEFNTDDVDEAYRQRLMALGLEPVTTIEEELETPTTEIAATATEDVDEALSQVFANPQAKLNPIVAAPIVPMPVPITETVDKKEVNKTDFSPLDFHVEEEAGTSKTDTAPISAEDKKASMLQQFRQLQDRNSTFVFMFGRQQAGKTVVLSSLAYHMGVDEHGLLETRRRVDNLKGAAYLKQLSESVRKGQFMNRTAVGSLYELDLTYTPSNPEIPMNFTFLEMSGEDLTKVELSESSAGNLPSDIEVYLKCPNLNLIFMLVVPYEDAEEHDYLVIDFLDYLKERKPDFDFSKLLLLISKWDRYDGLRKDEVDLFVKEQMPRTYSRLKAKKGTMARYSIGEVSDNNEEILELNQERPEVVKRWMYEAATGQEIKGERTSFWNKIKSWM